MKLYFDDAGFDGQFMRTVGYVSAGGADLGECWASAATIKAGVGLLFAQTLFD